MDAQRLPLTNTPKTAGPLCGRMWATATCSTSAPIPVTARTRTARVPAHMATHINTKWSNAEIVDANSKMCMYVAELEKAIRKRTHRHRQEHSLPQHSPPQRHMCSIYCPKKLILMQCIHPPFHSEPDQTHEPAETRNPPRYTHVQGQPSRW